MVEADGGYGHGERSFQTFESTAAIAETSKSSFTFSLTRTPPVSRAAYQLRPQSVRLT
jgi:hypothetical protein